MHIAKCFSCICCASCRHCAANTVSSASYDSVRRTSILGNDNRACWGRTGRERKVVDKEALASIFRICGTAFAEFNRLYDTRTLFGGSFRIESVIILPAGASRFKYSVNVNLDYVIARTIHDIHGELYSVRSAAAYSGNISFVKWYAFCWRTSRRSRYIVEEDVNATCLVFKPEVTHAGAVAAIRRDRQVHAGLYDC